MVSDFQRLVRDKLHIPFVEEWIPIVKDEDPLAAKLMCGPQLRSGDRTFDSTFEMMKSILSGVVLLLCTGKPCSFVGFNLRSESA